MDMWAAWAEEQKHSSDQCCSHTGTSGAHTDGQKEAAESSAFKGNFGSSPQGTVFQGVSWTSWHPETPSGVHEVTEICVILDVPGLVHSHFLMSMQ